MRVLLADEHQTFRDCFQIALLHEAKIPVVATANGASELYPLAEEHRPDVVIMDLMRSDPDGIAAASELGRRGLPSRIMILTSLSNALFVGDAFDAGVRAY